MKTIYSLTQLRFLAYLVLLFSTTQVLADFSADTRKWLMEHKARSDIHVPVARIDGIDAQISDIKRQLMDMQNRMTAFGISNEQYRAETTRIKEETIATTKLLGESVASASESVNRLEVEHQRVSKELEDYKNQEAKREEVRRILEQRQWRFHRGLKELFIKGFIIEDAGMDNCFKRACEISSDFCTSYNELKKFKDNWDKFLQESDRFEKRFWELLAADAEMQKLIDQPIQPAISGSDNDLLVLGANPHNEIGL